MCVSGVREYYATSLRGESGLPHMSTMKPSEGRPGGRVSYNPESLAIRFPEEESRKYPQLGSYNEACASPAAMFHGCRIQATHTRTRWPRLGITELPMGHILRQVGRRTLQ